MPTRWDAKWPSLQDLLSSLSIIIPVYRDQAALEALLPLLVDAKRQGAEIIVVGTREDPSCAAIANNAGVRYMEAPKGRGHQLRAGAEVAGGSCLWFLHADSRVTSNAASEVVSALTERAWGRFDIAFDCGTPTLRIVATMMNWRSRASGIATGDQAMFARAESYRAVGGFPAWSLMEDVALSDRLKRAYGRPACLASRAVTSSRKWHREGVVRTILSMWRWRYRFWRGEDPDLLAREYYGAKR